MGAPRKQLGLVVGACLSVVLHATVILPVIVRLLSTPGSAAMLPDGTALELNAVPPQQEDRSHAVEPGIDRSRAVTLTWVGFEDYREHIAMQSTVEQAAAAVVPGRATAASLGAQQDDAPPPPGSTAPSPPAPPEPAAVVAQADASREAPVEARDEPTTEAPAAAAPGRSEPAGTESPRPAGIPEPEPRPVPTIADLLREALDALVKNAPAPLANESDPPGTPEPPRTESPRAESAPAGGAPPRETREAPRTPAAPSPPVGAPARPDRGGSGDGQPGDPMDREATPTSLQVDYRALVQGRPLAREGLELLPRAPTFTTLTRLTAVPANPIVELSFDRRGVPEVCRIVRSSGYTDVDTSVRTSLYRWRARGEALRDLEGGRTIDIRIRIILNPGAPG